MHKDTFEIISLFKNKRTNSILKASEYITKLLDCIGEHSGGNIYRGNFVE